jgi:hypothetical protein
MKKIFLSTFLIVATLVIAAVCNGAKARNAKTDTTEVKVTSNTVDKGTKIQVAILLDTSSSMDGLINQAKSRLWNIVNTLTTLKFKGKSPYIEIALYEYGNNGIRTDDYIRRVTPLTNDLDLISDKLFGLTTNGGYEYCGAVIKKAVDNLEWGKGDADMKLVYIAGNEPFTQGNVSYKTAIENALSKNIYVNTIHCGNSHEGIEGMWRDGATRGKGKFFNIDHNALVRFISTPYDDRISMCNVKLNDTYIGYGQAGDVRKESQIRQDKNAESVSSSNYAERVVSKTKKVYNNSSWDLVDKVKEDATVLEKMEETQLPKELQNKSQTEIKKYVAQKDAERTALQKEIDELAKKRQAYIDEEMKKEGDGGDDLGKAINQSVIDLALAMGYVVE